MMYSCPKKELVTCYTIIKHQKESDNKIAKCITYKFIFEESNIFPSLNQATKDIIQNYDMNHSPDFIRPYTFHD